MKTKLLALFILLVAITGCDKIKEEATVSVSTQLTSSIPVVVTGTSGSLKSTEKTAIVFSKSQELSLSGNTDLSKYINKLKEIDLRSLVVTVNGLTAGQEIQSIALDVTGVGNIFTQSNITMANNSFTPTIAAGKLAQVATKLLADKKITLTVAGSVSGPMSFTVGLNFDTRVIAYILD